MTLQHHILSSGTVIVLAHGYQQLAHIHSQWTDDGIKINTILTFSNSRLSIVEKISEEAKRGAV